MCKTHYRWRLAAVVATLFLTIPSGGAEPARLLGPVFRECRSPLDEHEPIAREEVERGDLDLAKEATVQEVRKRLAEFDLALASSTVLERKALIAKALRSFEVPLRASAVCALTSDRSEPDWSVPLLTEKLSDTAEAIQDLAFRAIEAYGALASRSAPALVALLFNDATVSLFDDATTVAERSERALHAMPSAALASLTASLADRQLDLPPLLVPGEEERDRRVLAISGFGEPARSQLGLLSNNESAQMETRCLAYRALAVIAMQTNGEPPGRPTSLEKCVTSLLTANPEAYQQYVAELSSGTKARRIAAASRLGTIRPALPAGISALGSALQDPDHDVQWQALNALASLGPHALPAAPALVDALEQPNLRKFASHVLRQMGSTLAPVSKQLTTLLASTDGETREAAISVLSRLGDYLVPALIESLNDPDLNTRLAGDRGLGKPQATLILGNWKASSDAVDGRERLFVLSQENGFDALQAIVGSPAQSLSVRCQAVRYLSPMTAVASGQRFVSYLQAAKFGLETCPSEPRDGFEFDLNRLPSEHEVSVRAILEWLPQHRLRTPALRWLSVLSGSGGELFELPLSTRVAIALVDIIHGGNDQQRDMAGDLLGTAVQSTGRPAPPAFLSRLFALLENGSVAEWDVGQQTLSCSSAETRKFLLDVVASRSKVGFQFASRILATCGVRETIPQLNVALSEPGFRHESAGALYILQSS